MVSWRDDAWDGRSLGLLPPGTAALRRVEMRDAVLARWVEMAWAIVGMFSCVILSRSLASFRDRNHVPRISRFRLLGPPGLLGIARRPIARI